MMRRKKIGLGTILKGVMALVVALGIAVAVLLQNLDINHYRDVVAAQVEQATGRRLSLEGEVHLSLGLTPSIVVERAAFANASWGSRPDMVRVEKLEVDIALIPALFGEIHIDRLVLVQPDILLETNAKGVGNWVLSPPQRKEARSWGIITAAHAETATSAAESPAGEPGKPVLPVIASVRIQEARVVWKDGQRHVERTLNLSELLLSADSSDAPAALDVVGVAEGVAFDLSGGLGPMADLLRQAEGQGGDPWPFALKGDVAGMAVMVDGTIDHLLAVDGLKVQFSVTAPNLEGLRPVVPSVPKISSLSVAGQVTAQDQVWEFVDGNIEFGAQKAAVTGRVNLQKTRPRIEAQVVAPVLNIGALTAVGATTASKEAASGADSGSSGKAPQKPVPSKKLFSSQKLNLSAARAVDASIDVQADKVILAKELAVTNLTLKVTAEAGRVRLDPVRAQMFGQPLTMTGTLNVPASGRAAVTFKGNATGVPLGDVLARLGTRDALSGVPTDVAISVKTAGHSVAGLMKGLNGRLRVDMREGEIKSALRTGWGSLAGLSGLFDSLFGKQSDARLLCGVVNVPIKAGVATWDRHVAVETSAGAVVSSGRIDFGREALDIGMRPLTRDGVGSVVGLFRVTGSLANPAVRLSEKEAARGILSLLGTLATGGTKALKQSLKESNTAVGSVCEAARQNTRSRPQASQKEPSSADQPAVDALKALEKGLKGLFQ